MSPLKNLVSAVMSSNSACFLRLSLGVVFYHLNLSLSINALLPNIPTGPLFSTTGLEASFVFAVPVADLGPWALQ